MPDDYRVSIHSSPLPLPLSCFVHAYIATEHAGVIDRYDVIVPGMFKNIPSYDGRIFKNLLSPETGFLIFFKLHPEKSQSARWKTKRHGLCTGSVDTPAYKLYQFIESGGLNQYPHKNHYRMIRGPNSNSFVQWIVNQVPECGLSLPWNAWGKDFNKTHT